MGRFVAKLSKNPTKKVNLFSLLFVSAGMRRGECNEICTCILARCMGEKCDGHGVFCSFLGVDALILLVVAQYLILQSVVLKRSLGTGRNKLTKDR